MTWLDATLLGILEGLTELLPISSTGHLILLGAWLGHNDEASKTIQIVIQLGAVIAVAVAFRGELAALCRGLARRDPAKVRLAAALLIGFVPAAITGYLLHRVIKDALFKPRPVAAALILGGAAMIGVEALRRRRRDPGLSGLEHVTPQRALVIGLFQCLSLWPGASRSMTTILGGQLAGLSTATAAEFSFLLAIPTLGAATLFDMATSGRALLSDTSYLAALLVGLVVSFVVALLVIAGFLRYVRRYGLAPFGVYRIALGALVLALVKPLPAPPADGGRVGDAPGLCPTRTSARFGLSSTPQ